MVLRLLAYGVRAYVTDVSQLFDAFIIASSIVELALDAPAALTPSPDDSGSTSAVSALRTLRLLRIFRLAKSWRALDILLQTMAKTVKDIRNFALLVRWTACVTVRGLPQL